MTAERTTQQRWYPQRSVLRISASVLTTLLLPALLQAATIERFATETTFREAANVANTINFDGLAEPDDFSFHGNPGSISVGGTEFQSNAAISVVNDGANSKMLIQRSATAAHRVTITPPSNTSAVGFRFTADQAANVRINSNGNIQAFSIGANPSPNLSFVGFVSVQEINSLAISCPTCTFEIDDIAIGISNETDQYSSNPLLIENLTLKAGRHIYRSDQSLTLAGKVQVGIDATLTLQAKQIILRPGLRVERGGQLSATGSRPRFFGGYSR